MGIFDKFRKKSGFKEENEFEIQYKDAITRNQGDIARHTGTYTKTLKDIEILENAHDTNNWNQPTFERYNPKFLNEIKTDEEKFQKYLHEKKEEAMRSKIQLERCTNISNFLRPNFQSDMNERRKIKENFASIINGIDPQDISEFRYHATNIYTTKQIIESGGLFSSVDRYKDNELCPGYVQTTNSNNEISVSKIDNLQYSIDFWSDNGVNENFAECLPCGCVFVLVPSDQEEKNMIKDRQMHNVDFRTNPERLHAIITTEECKDMVGSWMNENGFDKTLVQSFNEYEKSFAQEIESMKIDINNGSSYLGSEGTHETSISFSEPELSEI